MFRSFGIPNPKTWISQICRYLVVDVDVSRIVSPWAPFAHCTSAYSPAGGVAETVPQGLQSEMPVHTSITVPTIFQVLFSARPKSNTLWTSASRFILNLASLGSFLLLK